MQRLKLRKMKHKEISNKLQQLKERKTFIEEKIPKKLLEEIKSSDQKKLRKKMVYMVGGPPESYVPNCLHSFAVVGKKSDNKNELSYCSLRYLTASIMHGHYVVRQSIVKKVMKSTEYSEGTKAAVRALQGQTFPSIEHFFRALLQIRQREGYEEKLTEESLFERAAFPDAELQKLAKLNEDFNYTRGVVAPGHPDEGRRKTDRNRFEKNSSRLTVIPYSHIEPEILDDVFNQLKLYMLWINEQAGIGKNTDYWLKVNVHPEKTKQLINLPPHYKSLSPNRFFDLLGASLLQFVTLPNKDFLFETNCNKSTASLMQEAENRSAEKQGRNPECIKGPTKFHQKIGSSQRISIWNPLRPNLPGIIRNLVSPADNIHYPIPSVQQLIQDRKNILHIINAFELPLQIKALEQILDRTTRLGQAFSHMDKKAGVLEIALESSELTQAKNMLINARKLQREYGDDIQKTQLALETARKLRRQ